MNTVSYKIGLQHSSKLSHVFKKAEDGGAGRSRKKNVRL